MERIQLNERACFPLGFFNELKSIFKLAWPTSLSILFHYFIQPVSLMFCGHLGKTELASVAMALSMIYISCISIGRGLAFGGGLLFGVLCSFFIWAVLINTEKILLLLRQEEHVARMSQEYIEYFMPGALAYCWIFTLMRYLLCQNSVIPNLLICITSCGINALLHYCLIYVAGLGIRGSAISLALTYYCVLILLVSYIWLSGIYKETWPGWSRECLEDWGDFGQVATSSIFMTFIFWFCTEVGTFLAGLLSEQDISAFSICFQVEGFAWMIPLGLGSASTSRIGQFLGKKLPLGAITTCRVALTVQAFISVVMALLCYLFRYYIPMAFTTSKELIEYTGDVLPLVAIFLLLEGFGGVGLSIIRGTGRQTLGAIIIFVSFYIFALPIGIPLMFLTKLKLSGLWWGFIIGLGVQNLCLFAFVARMNWQAETDKAQIRAGISINIQQSDHVDYGGRSDLDDYEKNDENDELIGQEEHHRVSSEHRVDVGDETETDDDDDELIIKPSLLRLILMRLPIFLAFVAMLVGGVCIHIFVPIDKHECIPADLVNSSTISPPSVFRSMSAFYFIDGLSLDPHVPWCNDTLQSLAYGKLSR